jgi:hypothetical protein
MGQAQGFKKVCKFDELATSDRLCLSEREVELLGVPGDKATIDTLCEKYLLTVVRVGHNMSVH